MHKVQDSHRPPHPAALPASTDAAAPRAIPPPTPVRFPQVAPKAESKVFRTPQHVSLVDLLQTIHRPADIKLSHFEAVGVHVIPDASAPDLIPDSSYLPPSEKWNELTAEALLEVNEATRKPLGNGNLSPGVQTYRERQKELLIDNTAAFRTIRRIPAPTGETPARLGNAYEFFKNLEFFSGYWPDTSLPAKSEPPTDEEKQRSRLPTHQQTHVRVGNGSQLPPEYRQNLITAFVKLVAYDFGCNVSFPRTEPRLHLTPSPRASPEPTPPPSYFNSSATFIYRMPVERSSARAGIVEGPVAAVSARATTTFATPADETLDLAREIVAILLTAQQRARDGKTERRFGDGEWWTMRPRWGGGPGGPIGKEADTAEGAASAPDADGAEKSPPAQTEDERAAVKMANEVKRQIGGIANRTPNPAKRPKKSKEGSLMAIYDAYRRMTPPSGTWDRRARYSAIGKVQGEAYDDVFLISALNHHICVVRAKVPEDLLVVLEGEEKGSWERLEVRRSRWWDLYLKEDRVEAMNVVWGVMSWLMRKVEHPKEKAAVQLVEKMDLSC
ncbi:unnamed protein product [Diplocarpon coronariae]|uniref:Uncharacterized protein n=1 Tax=Diplocarpon coronariae TaxID=2795749 RepID=A0A218YSD7_9HELO|nr:hypothetical protein JHW43_009043 [Diplocarpon mali]OWO97962.1 hypothetical protein B2J93_3760 [Marssonina coronariae]